MKNAFTPIGILVAVILWLFFKLVIFFILFFIFFNFWAMVREAIAQGNSEAATEAITTVDENLQNSSSRISGLGQHLANIAENQTLSIDQPTRQTLMEIGDALISVAPDHDGVYQANSSSS
jgi:Flp pilus assembly protein TadG